MDLGLGAASTPSRRLDGEPINVAIVGVGTAGRAYSAALDEDERFRLVAAVDPAMDRARAVLAPDAVPLRTIHDLIDVADDLNLQAAIVCAPTITHVPLITALLERGIGVLCHPPLAPSRPSARMIIDTAQRSKAPLLVALDHRRSDDVAAAADLLATGELGETRMVRVHLRGSEPAEHGILRELGTLALDLVRALVGPIRLVAADAADVSDARTTTAQLLVKTEVGVSVSVSLSADSALASGWDVLVEAADGALRLDANGLSVHRGLGWETVCARTSVGERRARHLDDLAAAVRSESVAATPDLADTLAAVAVLEAARRSVEAGGWARVIPDRSPSPQSR